MVNTLVAALDYLFTFSPDRLFPLQWIPWTLIGISLLLSGFLFYRSRTCKDAVLRKLIQEYPGKFVTISILLAINVLTRLYRIEVLSMRVFTFILIAWMLFAFYGLYHDWRVTYPQRKALLTPKFQRLEEKYHIHRNKGRKTRRNQR